MATITRQKPNPPETIDRFLGLNEDTTGDTQLQLGESPSMINYRITENYKLRKREGYEQLFASLGSFDIQGMWYGSINGSYHFLFAANGHVYEHDLNTGTNTSKGTLTDAKTFFFAFGEKVYMLNGSEYKYWDGVTFGDVAGYIPLIATATPPTGGGTENESLNLLTGKKRQTFSGNNSATSYQLAETALTSVDVVKVSGVVKTVTTDYTVNLTTGVVTFVVAPPTGVDNVDIQWTKGSGSRSEITGHKFAMFFGGQNDTRAFFYGNGTNRYNYTGLASGVPSAEYLPALNYREISSDEFAVTDIVRQYDRQIIFTNGGEAWYSYYDPLTLDSGDVIADFPTFPLNQTKGNVTPGQSRLINNNPFTVFKGVQEWVATNVRDERNANFISKRVQSSIEDFSLPSVLTVDWEKRWEYWISYGSTVIVYNYRLDVWYKYTLAHNVTCFLVKDDELHFGTDDGMIMKFGDDLRNDNGTIISAEWEMAFYDFNAEWLQKFINEMWISLKPTDISSVEISYQTDRVVTSGTYVAVYNNASFANMNFADFSFYVNYNPQPFRFKIKAKKFVYFKIVLRNEKLNDKLTVLSINLAARYGSKSR
ncbi:hypothetical protein [Cohnella sp. GCM10027633]|uniref:hypothetical protein n=1 Tax=unclassified Cohnella TaxID=2636738 RepID=UPI00362D8E17